MGVFFLRWEEPGFLTFELDAQHHHDVGILDGFVKIHLQLCAHFRDAARNERGRSANGDVAAKFIQQEQIAAHNAGMGQIADNDNLEALEFFFVVADRHEIQKRLRWMLVHPVAGVDDVRVDVLGQQFMSAAVWMAHDDDVWIIGVDRLGSVDEPFALLDARRRGRNVEDVGALIFCSQLKRRARARAVFVEKIDDGDAAQILGLFHAAHLIAHLSRQSQDFLNLFNAELIDADEIFMF